MKESEKNVLVMLAKKPENGKVKTRIARDTSDSFALNIALTSIKDIEANLNNNKDYDFIVATDTQKEIEWFKETHNLDGILIKQSEDKNLSYKMKFVFKTLLEDFRYNKAALIPMDMPFLTSKEIIQAFSKLDNCNYVLGPEPNGGVYLIGMTDNSLKLRLFDSVPWSTPQSFKMLLNNFGVKETSVLEPKDDFNTFQDILNNKESIKIFCPNLDKLLQKELDVLY